MKLGFVLLAMGLAGACNKYWTPVTPSSDNEVLILAETTRLAGELGVHVEGIITDSVTPAQLAGGGCPSGWYQAGKAYYYRPKVALMGSPGWETVTNVAGHEVCHAISFFHDHKHWSCMARIASPTYPDPGTP